MKQPIMGALLLASSLATPPTVAAQCAWVLWEEYEGSGREWNIVGTAPSSQECGRGADLVVADRGARWRGIGVEVEVAGNQVTVKGSSPWLKYRYLCLPDTIDPRGPKSR